MWDRKSAKRLLNNTRRYRSGTVVIVAWRWPGSRDIIRVRKKRKEKGREEIMRKGENDLICHSDEVLCSALVPCLLHQVETRRVCTFGGFQVGPPACSRTQSSLISLSASTAELRTWPSVDTLCLEAVDGRFSAPLVNAKGFSGGYLACRSARADFVDRRSAPTDFVAFSSFLDSTQSEPPGCLSWATSAAVAALLVS